MIVPKAHGSTTLFMLRTTAETSHAPLEPQELELPGSVKIDYCIKFYYMKKVLAFGKESSKPGIVNLNDKIIG